MSLEISISPGGRLFVERVPEIEPEIDQKLGEQLSAAFEKSAEAGLVLLATDALAVPLPPSPAYWRDFARGYLQRLCQTSESDTGPTPLLALDRDELSDFVQQAPPMRGGEFLTLDLLEKLWQEFGNLVTSESRLTGLSAWLKARNPLWHTVGRVTFHLAENKRDPNRPFAFLATYTHRLSDRGKAQHLPLARALQEYGGTKNKAALTALLSPVQRAAEKSDLARELVETRRLFQPLAWTPRDAHRFLRHIPAFEESGLLVRVPDWWKSGRTPRPQVNVRIGEKPTNLLSLQGLMDFSIEVALDGEQLTTAEWHQLMSVAASREVRWRHLFSRRNAVAGGSWADQRRRPAGADRNSRMVGGRAGRMVAQNTGRDARSVADRRVRSGPRSTRTVARLPMRGCSLALVYVQARAGRLSG